MTAVRVSVISPCCWNDDYVLYLDLMQCSLCLQESVFAGLPCFCRNFASIWQVGPATCTSASRKKPTTKPPGGKRKIRGALILFFLAEIPCVLIETVIKYPPNKQEKNRNKKTLYCFRINPEGDKTSVRTTLCLASALLLQGPN